MCSAIHAIPPPDMANVESGLQGNKQRSYGSIQAEQEIGIPSVTPDVTDECRLTYAYENTLLEKVAWVGLGVVGTYFVYAASVMLQRINAE